MTNVFGNAITVILFGESHGEMIGAVLDGIAPGIAIDYEYIDKKLAMRRPSGKISTARVEADKYNIVSGVYNGYTTGTPLTILIENTNTKSSDYCELKDKPRPGHADYTAGTKYHGYQDPRGGGHFSGRITAALVAIGAILSSALSKKSIEIGTQIASIGAVKDRGFDNIAEDVKALDDILFPVLSEKSAEEMTALIESVASEGDSIGGVISCQVNGLPAGLGEPMFGGMENRIAQAVFGIPAVKGIEFGAGFSFAGMTGSRANDAFYMDDGKIKTKTNNNGGINGGITNGMPILFRCAVKPTPSIYKEQQTVDMLKGEDSKLQIVGRHDPAIIHRASIVITSVTKIALADLIITRYGNYGKKD